MFGWLLSIKGSLGVKVEETGKAIEIAKGNNSSGICGFFRIWFYYHIQTHVVWQAVVYLLSYT